MRRRYKNRIVAAACAQPQKRFDLVFPGLRASLTAGRDRKSAGGVTASFAARRLFSGHSVAMFPFSAPGTHRISRTHTPKRSCSSYSTVNSLLSAKTLKWTGRKSNGSSRGTLFITHLTSTTPSLPRVKDLSRISCSSGRGDHTRARQTLPTTVFHYKLTPDEEKPRWGYHLFRQATNYLGLLTCHVTVLQPGAGYEPHINSMM